MVYHNPESMGYTTEEISACRGPDRHRGSVRSLNGMCSKVCR